MARPRLEKGDITLREILTLSRSVYGKLVDNKKARLRDIVSAKFNARTNLTYNREKNDWEQTGREVKIQFLVVTDPVTYERPKWDTKKHKYPITFLLKDFDAGMDSAFRARVGSNFKPKFHKKKVREQTSDAAKDKVRKDNQKIDEYNLAKGIQLQFFFDSMRVYRLWGLLFGPDYTKWNPMIRNPRLIPFFSKHEFFIVTKIFPRMFNNPKLNQLFKKKP